MLKRASLIILVALYINDVISQSVYPKTNVRDSLIADSLIDQAIEFYLLKEYEASFDNSLQAIRIFKQFCELDMLAYSYHLLAGLSFEQGNLVMANDFIEKALENSHLIKEAYIEDYIDIITTNALIKSAYSNPFEGLKKRQEIIDRYLDQYPKENQCIQYLNLGIQYSRTNDNHTCLSYLIKAFHCSTAASPIDDQVQIALEIVNLYLDLNDYDNALTWLSFPSRHLIDNKVSNSSMKALELRTLGRVAKEYEKQFQKSINLFRKSIHVEASAFLVALALSQIGTNHDLLSNCDSARMYYDRSIKMLDTLYGSRSNISSLEFMLKKLKSCSFSESPNLELIDSIRTINRSHNSSEPLSRFVEKEIFHLLAHHDTTLEKINLYSQAIDQINQIRFGIRSIESKLYKTQDDKEIFDDAIRSAIEYSFKYGSSELLKQAFYWSDISKGSVLSEQISRNTMLRKYSTDTSYKLFMDLNSEIHALKRQIANNRSEIESFDPEALLLEKQNELARIENEAQFDPEVKSEKEFFQQLSNPNVLIWEGHKNHKSYTFITYTNGKIIQKEVSHQIVDSLLDVHLKNQIESIPARDHYFINSSAKLYSLIFPENIDWNEIEHLVVVPDSKFHHLSFETLIPQYTPSSDPASLQYSYLFEKCSISYSFGIHLNRKYPRPSNTHVSVFSPTFNSDAQSLDRDCSQEEYGSLRCNNNEAQFIDEVLEAKIYSHQNATSHNITSALEKSTYIHMATHACVDTINYYNSAIILDDGPYLLSDLYQTDWQNKTVVLSACNTAKGSFLSGEGVFNFSRTLTELGVREVIVTLWPVDDCSTADFMRHFYSHISENHPTHKALQLARSSYLQEADKLHQAPQFWAPFILISNDIGLFSAETDSSLGFLWLLLIPMSLGCFWYFLRAKEPSSS